MNRKLFDAQVAQYKTPTVTGEGEVILENNIRSYLPHMEIDGNTFQQTYEGYNLFDQEWLLNNSDFSKAEYNGFDCIKAYPTSTNANTFNLPTHIPNGSTVTVSFEFAHPDTGSNFSIRLLYEDGTTLAMTAPSYSEASSEYRKIVATKQATKNVVGLQFAFFGIYANRPYYFKDIMLNIGNEKAYEPYVGGIASPNPGQIFEPTEVTMPYIDISYASSGDPQCYLIANNAQTLIDKVNTTYKVWVDEEIFSSFAEEFYHYEIVIAKTQKAILNGSDGDGNRPIIIASYHKENGYVFNPVYVDYDFYIGVGNTDQGFPSVESELYWRPLKSYEPVRMQEDIVREIIEYPQPIKSVNDSDFIGLPYEYQEVEYIESTGTQYIDTGLVPYFGLNTEINVIPIDAGYLFGSTNGQNIDYYGFLFSVSGACQTFLGTGSYLRGGSWSANTEYDVKIIGKKGYVDNVQIADYETVGNIYTFNTTQPIFLFGLNYNNTYNGSKMRIKSCKFYDDNGVVRNYIPCYRKNDNEIGLYDLINNVFYTNKGTGKFNKGADIVKLPTEYQQVAYIESTGTQYIDTGVVANENIKIISKVQINYTESTLDKGRAGMVLGGKKGWMVYGDYGQGKLGSYFSTTSLAGAEIPFDTEWHTYHLENGLQKIDEIEANNTVTGTIDGLSLYLLQVHIGWTGQTMSASQRFAYAQIWDNGVLVRDYVPCYRKSDGVIGLYDLVEDKFYVNSGTGTFLKGDDLDSIITKKIVDISDATILNNINLGASVIESLSGSKVLYIEIQGGKTYDVSIAKNSRFSMCTTTTVPVSGVSIYNRTDAGALTPSTTPTTLSLTANDDAKYLVVRYFYSSTDTYTEQEILDTIKISYEQDYYESGLELAVRGTNLFDIDNPLIISKDTYNINGDYIPKIENGIIYNGGVYGYTDGASLCIKTDNKSVYTFSYNLEFDETTQTTISEAIYLYNEPTNGIATSHARTSRLFGPSANVKQGKNVRTINCQGYDYIGISWFGTSKYALKITDLQIENVSGETFKFDFSPIKVQTGFSTSGITNVTPNSVTITNTENSPSNFNGYTGSGVKVSVICPQLEVGKKYILNFDSDQEAYCNQIIYFAGANKTWTKKTQILEITQAMLNSTLVFYGYKFESNSMVGDVVISNMTATEVYDPSDYEPYINTTIFIPTKMTLEDGTVIDLRFAKVQNPDKLIVDRTNKKVTYIKNNDLHIFTGNESMGRAMLYEHKGNLVLSCSVSNVISSDITLKEVLCNKFQSETPNLFVNDNQTNKVTTSKGEIWFTIPRQLIGATDDNSTQEILALFKTWLQAQYSSDSQLYAVYAIEPIEYDVTNTDLGQQLLNIETQNGTNIFNMMNTENQMTPTITIKHLIHS